MAYDECTRKVVDAATAESAAMDLDRRGDVPAAIRKYEECERALSAAIEAALPAHADDRPKLVQHRAEIVDRLQHLRGLRGSAPTIPLEDQIHAVQLGMQAANTAAAAVSSGGGIKVLGATAALGGAAGFMLLGPVGLVGGAAAAGYCATRSDKVGEVARAAGALAVTGAERAMELNSQYKVTDKLQEAGSKAVTAAMQANEKYGIADKLAKGTSAAVATAIKIENQYKVTDTVASGLASGLTKLSSALDSTKKGRGSGAA